MSDFNIRCDSCGVEGVACKCDLLATLSMLTTGRGTASQRLARAQKTMIGAPEAMAQCGLPSGQKRAALTAAMEVAQTPAGKRYAVCVVCGEPCTTSTDRGRAAYAVLTVLLPSILWSDDEVAGTDKRTAHRLGYVPGNVALACSDCAAWRATNTIPLTAKWLDAVGFDASMILTSWEGIGYSRGKTDTDAESRARRAQKRAERLGGA